MVDVTPFLPGLSPVQGKAVAARFDGGRLSSEGGLLALREIERAGIGRPLGHVPEGPACSKRSTLSAQADGLELAQSAAGRGSQTELGEADMPVVLCL